MAGCHCHSSELSGGGDSGAHRFQCATRRLRVGLSAPKRNPGPAAARSTNLKFPTRSQRRFKLSFRVERGASDMQVPLAVPPRGPGLGLPGNLGDSPRPPPAEHGLTWLGLGSELDSESKSRCWHWQGAAARARAFCPGPGPGDSSPIRCLSVRRASVTRRRTRGRGPRPAHRRCSFQGRPGWQRERDCHRGSGAQLPGNASDEPPADSEYTRWAASESAGGLPAVKARGQPRHSAWTRGPWQTRTRYPGHRRPFCCLYGRIVARPRDPRLTSR